MMKTERFRSLIRSILSEGEGEVIDITDRLPGKPPDEIDEMLQDIYETLGSMKIPENHTAGPVVDEILSALDLYFGSEIEDDDEDGEVSQDERSRFLAHMNSTRDDYDDDDDL